MLCLVDNCKAHASVTHFNGDDDDDSPYGVSCPDHADTPRILAPSCEDGEYQAQYAYACGYYD